MSQVAPPFPPGRFDTNGVMHVPSLFTIRRYKRAVRIAEEAIESIKKTRLYEWSSDVAKHLSELEDAIFCLRWNRQPSLNPAEFAPCKSCSGRGWVFRNDHDCSACRGAGLQGIGQ